MLEGLLKADIRSGAVLRLLLPLAPARAAASRRHSSLAQVLLVRAISPGKLAE